jgi:hypothetical protein
MGLGEVVVLVVVGVVVAAALCWAIVAYAVKRADTSAQAHHRPGDVNHPHGR